MMNRNSTRKYNKLLTAGRNYPVIKRNYFDGGGNINGGADGSASGAQGGGMGKMAAIGAIATEGNKDLAEMYQNIQAEDVKQKAAEKAAEVNSSQMAAQSSGDSFDALTADASNLAQIAHVSAKQLGAKNGLQIAAESQLQAAQGAAAGTGLGPIGMIASAAGGLVSSLVGNLVRNRKARREARKLNARIDYTNDFNQRSIANRAENLIENQASDLAANYAAYGGGIHIAPNKRGTFTAAATRHNMSVQEFANKVLANKEDYSPLMVKKANFSRNASNWHDDGGFLNSIHGGDFTNGLMAIENGGSHENNPFEGVPMGVDNEGTPNLVEEGETIFNDYVFSKRLMIPKAIRNKYNLRGKKDLSFADASKKLAKESEERPNDPISERGLIALMSDLANAQEAVRETQQIRNNNKMSYGGNIGILYAGEGAGSQKLKFNNQTAGISFEEAPNFNPYQDDKTTIDWDKVYDSNSPYMKRRQHILDHWGEPETQEWLSKYVEGINKYNEGKKGYIPMQVSDITQDIFNKRTFDKSWGGFHAGIGYAGNPEDKIVYEHKLRNADGTISDMPEAARYYANTDFETGKTWEDTYGDKYTRANKGEYTEQYDPKTHTRTRRYFYDPVASKEEEVDKPVLQEDQLKQGKYQTWLRYAPVVGYGLGAIASSFKPDYSNADMVLEAAKNAGNYTPVGFNPIGNYLAYKPFDRDYYINKLNAESGATRRALLQNAGLNRGAATAAILSADYNAQSKLGDLARKAEEYNLAQRQGVEEFNRQTNIANSEGMLKADIANQEAQAKARDAVLKGTMAGAELRQQIKDAADKSRSDNLSGLFETLGDIGFEEKNAKMRDWAISHGIYGPGTEDYGRFKKATDKSDKSKPKSTKPKKINKKRGKRSKYGLTLEYV